jgi:hypothetical protein
MGEQKGTSRRFDTKTVASRSFFVVEQRATTIERALRDVVAVEDVPDVNFVIAQLDGIA